MLLRLRLLLAGLGLLLALAARAQTTPHGYDFLTVTTLQGIKSPVLLLSPAFEGKTETPLEDVAVMGVEKYKAAIHRNAYLVNQQLSALTTAGWELVQVYTEPSQSNARCYLFRKPRP